MLKFSTTLDCSEMQNLIDKHLTTNFKVASNQTQEEAKEFVILSIVAFLEDN